MMNPAASGEAPAADQLRFSLTSLPRHTIPFLRFGRSKNHFGFILRFTPAKFRESERFSRRGPRKHRIFLITIFEKCIVFVHIPPPGISFRNCYPAENTSVISNEMERLGEGPA